MTINTFDISDLTDKRFDSLDKCRKAIKKFLENPALTEENRKYYDDKICVVRDKSMKYCVKLARD